MSNLTDTIYDQAQAMVKHSFADEQLLSRLPDMSRAEIDALDFGVVQVDDSGKILLYNRYESELAGVAPPAAEGKSFFTEIAPCTNNNLFYGSFKKGLQEGLMNVLFFYTFTYRMRPTNVKVHLHRHDATRTNWVLVQKK